MSSEAFFDNDFQGVGGNRGDQSLGHRGGRTGVKAGVVEQLLQNPRNGRILCRTKNDNLLKAF